MTQASGWYDDPQDPSKLRYWDGVIWTEHTTPKQLPTLEQPPVGMPSQTVSPAPQPTAQPGYPAYPGQAPAPVWGQPYVTPPAVTPDGVPLSGWWKRVAALILDQIIVSIISLPLTFVFIQRFSSALSDFVDRMVSAANSGQRITPADIPSTLYSNVAWITLITLAVYLVYEIAFLTLKGATPGKMALGISVRLRDRPGPAPFGAVVLRTIVKEIGGAAGVIPYVGTLGDLFRLVNYLWPLWDVKKQALHDKVAATNVVVGRQPSRASVSQPQAQPPQTWQP